jgi:HlyD family secretion protein
VDKKTRRRRGTCLLSAVALALALGGCAAAEHRAPGAPAPAPAGGVLASEPAAPQPARMEPLAQPTTTVHQPIAPTTRGISAVGTVMAGQEAELSFSVQGTVQRVLVAEGDVVEAGDVLAVLDTRMFDRQVEEAQASLDVVLAQEAKLTEAPSRARVAAAQAQVRQAQIALEQARATEPQSLRSAEASVVAAQSSLESARDQLSRRKTQAEAAVQQRVQQLVQAQAAYAKAKSDWEFVRETGQNPAQPEIVDSRTGEERENKVEDTVREQYYATFVQAEASLRLAEQQVQEAQVDAEQARRAELEGIRSAEQQLVQAQAARDKLILPDRADQVAAAQAQLDQARANLDVLEPAPSDADIAQAQAQVRRAQAALASARLNRGYAELRAPFDGTISAVNIDPGDPSASTSLPLIEIVDTGALHIEMSVNEVDIARVRVGEQVVFQADALPDTDYTGAIRSIAPVAAVRNGVSTYLVRIDVPEPAGLRPGMTVRVRGSDVGAAGAAER